MSRPDPIYMKDAQWLVEKIYAVELGKANYKGCSAYRDFRELLARKDIDGVLVVTPNHWLDYVHREPWTMKAV